MSKIRNRTVQFIYLKRNVKPLWRAPADFPMAKVVCRLPLLNYLGGLGRGAMLIISGIG
jgi:hypothetical protein